MSQKVLHWVEYLRTGTLVAMTVRMTVGRWIIKWNICSKSIKTLYAWFGLSVCCIYAVLTGRRHQCVVFGALQNSEGFCEAIDSVDSKLWKVCFSQHLSKEFCFPLFNKSINALSVSLSGLKNAFTSKIIFRLLHKSSEELNSTNWNVCKGLWVIKGCEGYTWCILQNKDCLQRILEIETTFNGVWWCGSLVMQPY